MPTREELYERIRASSLDEVVVEEMQRLGFWPRESTLPEDPVAEIKRVGDLERELGRLRRELSRVEGEEKLKALLRKRRMEASRERRKFTKEKRLWERRQRAYEWQLRKQRELLYLGDGVSAGLHQQRSDEEALVANKLPVAHTALDLSKVMGVDLGHLRQLAFVRPVSRTTHYVRFALPKKSGGTRLISAPMPKLKAAQRWILDHILVRPEVDAAAHGFYAGRSIVTNARVHVGAAIVVNLDIADFFPTLTYPRVKGLFRKLGYSEQIATVLGLLCTEPEVAEVALDGSTYYVQQGPRFLPQGSPASPAITNLVCRRLDARLSRVAKHFGFTYSRYADDFTFSTQDRDGDVGKLLGAVRRIIASEGFTIHPDKTRVQRPGRRQEVTGLVVSGETPTVPRATLRRFRALLHQIERDGPEGKQWNQAGDVLSAIGGFASFVHMVDPEKGSALLARVGQIRKRFGKASEPPAEPSGVSWEVSRARYFPPLVAPAPPEDAKPTEPTTRDPERPARSSRTERRRGGASPFIGGVGADAPFKTRAYAKCIDLLTVAGITFALSHFVSPGDATLIAWTWFLIADWAGSPGKALLKLQTVSGDSKVGFAQSVRRNLAPCFYFGATPLVGALSGLGRQELLADYAFSFGVLSAARLGLLLWEVHGLRRDGQRPSDRWAGTRVVLRG